MAFETTGTAVNMGKCFIIAEVGQSHDGSLGMAHAFIDAISKTGADAVKFQTHIADAESTFEEPWRVQFSRQDKRRYDYWKRLEFTEDQWSGLKHHADEVGLRFLSSPFSIKAIELLERVGVYAWKVASPEVCNMAALERIVQTGIPVLLSSGMCYLEELDRAVAYVKQHNLPVTVLQCTSAYPCPLEKVGLNLMAQFRDRYGCDVGLSDHSGTPFPALAAMARGASAIEVHVTFDRQMFGPDVSSSLTFDELALLANARDAYAKMDAHPVDKDTIAQSLEDLRKTFGRSLAVSQPLKAGTVMERDLLTLKKPGTGIPADDLSKIIGRSLVRDVGTEHLLQWEDLDG
jgi:N,N'-diacetyllegionaminate synthase